MFLGITHLVYTSFYYIVNLIRRATALHPLKNSCFFIVIALQTEGLILMDSLILTIFYDGYRGEKKSKKNPEIGVFSV